jgi:hypothetical protein
MPRGHALARLATAATADAAGARRLLDGLVEAGVLAARGAEVEAAPTYRPWLEALLSGHLVEIERTPLAAAGEVDRLSFVGPPGHRVVCGPIDRATFEGHLHPGAQGGAPRAGAEVVRAPSEHVLLLAHLSAEALSQRLEDLLQA